MLRKLVLAAGIGTTSAATQSLDALPSHDPPGSTQAVADWLVVRAGFPARVERGTSKNEIVLSNGLIRRAFRVRENLVCVAFDDQMRGESLLRAAHPEARLWVDGTEYAVGGMAGQPHHAWLDESMIDALRPVDGAFGFVRWSASPIAPRLNWQRVRHHAPDAEWPPKGISLAFEFEAPAGGPDLVVTVRYDLYDGVPCLSKQVLIHNRGTTPVRVDRIRTEELAIVEHGNPVEARSGVALPKPEHLHVETDFAFGGFNFENANRHVVHWRTDPEHHTQVNYLRQMPCLLVVEPSRGPGVSVAPGERFDSFTTFELVHDSLDRERQGLGLRRMYRTVAPWITENPLMMHLRHSDPESVRRAIDQCAEVGFEMLILSFGSGFDIEDRSEANLTRWRSLAEYAKSKDIEIGGYSLYSSRRIGNGQDIVCPPGESHAHGACPALTSEWGQRYVQTLREFFRATGFTLLEHDGPYPGDVDVTSRPPLQRGVEDSQWLHWKISTDFYEDCRARGIYVNAPDHYFLNGTSKCGMGYRETNWSLPRDDQVIHTRQNIYDGTWRKPPSLGWMFVPLSEYHGGGAAATIEPLAEHLDHYDRMLTANLAMGVQACYRGPRLFDTSATRDLLAARVAWFKQYRDILESDMVHGRRADGRDIDWMLHVNPDLPERALLVVFNPLTRAVTREIRVDLRYSGLVDHASFAIEDRAREELVLDRDRRVRVTLDVPAGGFTWAVFRPE
ncbi:MAG: alpha-galactosidase [Planctomycetota bacterium]